jgi:hypothetical protein
VHVNLATKVAFRPSRGVSSFLSGPAGRLEFRNFPFLRNGIQEFDGLPLRDLTDVTVTLRHPNGGRWAPSKDRGDDSG